MTFLEPIRSANDIGTIEKPPAPEFHQHQLIGAGVPLTLEAAWLSSYPVLLYKGADWCFLSGLVFKTAAVAAVHKITSIPDIRNLPEITPTRFWVNCTTAANVPTPRMITLDPNGDIWINSTVIAGLALTGVLFDSVQWRTQ